MAFLGHLEMQLPYSKHLVELTKNVLKKII